MQSFCQAAAVLPERLRRCAIQLAGQSAQQVEEIRLRIGRPLFLGFGEGDRQAGEAYIVQREDIELLVQMASRWSLHSVLDQINQGYLTIEGGHRLGLCGTAVMESGQLRTFREISSVNLRIARQINGCARDIALRIKKRDMVENTLIVAQPGAGKTTLLRDLIRCLSQGGIRVSVADERGELAAMWQGRAQMDLGACTDVMSGCPKALAVKLLLRAMNPQVIAVDEITAPEDVQAMEQAVGCGVCLLATAHATDAEDLKRRPLYQGLLAKKIFRWLVIIEHNGGCRKFHVTPMEELLC